MNGYLAAFDLFHIFTQSVKFHEFHYQVLRVHLLEKSDIDGKNKWLRLSASSTTNVVLVFVLTMENAFSYRFDFKGIRRSMASSKMEKGNLFLKKNRVPSFS